MTAVLSANALRLDRIMSSHDDNQINYSSSNAMTDWKEKYYEAADMLAETRTELDEFQHSSKELEEELERELERTEKVQQELRLKVARAQSERDEWKSKFVSLQTTHNTTTTSLQRELDTLRQSHQQLQVQLRELEMGNDDLERNERAVSSSLADIEAKYSRTLEEKILLEHELLDKANLEEECQRLKDELRDSNLEVSVLTDQLSKARPRTSTLESTSSSAPSSLMPSISPSDEHILSTPPPADLLLSDLAPETSSKSSASSASSSSATSPVDATPRQQRTLNVAAGQSALLRRAGFPSSRSNSSPSISSNPNPLARSSLPTWSPYRNAAPSPIPRPPHSGRSMAESASPSTSTFPSVPETTSKSKAVQMVSDMRARIRNIDQMITRVPRLRLGSISGRNPASGAASSVASVFGSSTNTPENPRGTLKRRSADSVNERKGFKNSDKNIIKGDTSGWVLIMEDAISPSPNRDKDHRRLSGPSASPFRPSASVASSPVSPRTSDVTPGNLSTRRPQSRLSISTDGRASTSTTATISSIPTPTSRPATPTFLPIPTSGMYSQGMPPLKRSAAAPQKRSSLGSNTTGSPSLQPPHETYHRERPVSVQAYRVSPTANKALPQPPPNVTIRAPRAPSAGGNAQSALAQSRIGRPTSLGGPNTGRKSTGSEAGGTKDGRARAGSATVPGGRLTGGPL